jgi:uncharacterized membrane protein
MSSIMTDAVLATTADTALFDAEITPSAPFSRSGLFGTALALLAMCAVAMLAVWPHSQWLAVSLALTTAVVIHFLCRLFDEAISGPAEAIRLDRRGLTVMRRAGAGRFEVIRLEPFWARVSWEPGEDLRLVAGARSVVVGASLSDEERAGLAAALGDALRRFRTPGFA